jgi:CheY-like chemotaxis protein
MPDEQSTVAASQTHGVGTQHADGTPVRVLVVDDEPSLAELLSSVLRYEGWSVQTAGSGTDAIKTGREFRPDAVVLDIMLPDFDGLEVMRRLRAEIPGVCVLFLTARDAVEDRVAGLTAGGDDYVTKPFSLEEVLARLRGLLRRANLSRTSSEGALVVADLTMDEDAREVRRGGELVDLTGALQGADPRPGLELRLRRPGPRGRALHQLPAQEDRRGPRPAHPHRPRRRLRAEAGRLTPANHDR